MNYPFKKQFNLAFTMAEAILVMTILGIIATIMITTLKPAKFKDKGLKILYKKVLAEIDTATTEILLKNSASGKMNKLFVDNDGVTFSFSSDLAKTTKLYKKYLASTRKEYDISKDIGKFSQIVQQSSNSSTQTPPFYLKDGALLFLGAGEKYQFNPSQNTNIDVEGCAMQSNLLGLIALDINGEEKPNVLYKDQFLLPVGKNGIEYEAMCDGLEVVNVTPTPEPEPEEPEEEGSEISDPKHDLLRDYMVEAGYGEPVCCSTDSNDWISCYAVDGEHGNQCNMRPDGDIECTRAAFPAFEIDMHCPQNNY